MSRYSDKQIRAVRKANKMTQAEFAKAMNVSVRTIKRWEKSGIHSNSYSFSRWRFTGLEQPELPL